MKKLLTLLAMILVSAGAMASTRPFNLSLTPNAAVYDRGDKIEGVTISIWGENEQESFALGIANGMIGSSSGGAVGIVNYADRYKGVQLGLVNCAKQDVRGWQGCFFFSFVNWASDTMTGLQTGVVNFAGNIKGVQIGLVNYADDSKAGVQIGLINILPKNKWFSALPDELAPGMIFVNWRF